VITTRGQFLAAFLVTMLGIVALVRYGFVALRHVAEDGDRMQQEFTKLQTISELEDAARDLGRATTAEAETAARARLDQLTAEARALVWYDDETPLLADLLRSVEFGHPVDRDAWIKTDELSNRLGDVLIARSRRVMNDRETAERTTDRARKTLLLGGAVVAFFGAASAFVYRRMQRERREAQEHLRRSDRLAALGTVAASVAHEINNPLATISGCAGAVRDRLRREAGSNEDSIEYLDMIVDESRRCSGIVKGLGDLARDGPPAVAPTELPKLARSVVALLEVDRRAKPVSFHVLGEPRLEAICDPDKMKQLLLNLLINARDASHPQGAVTVTVERVGADAARIVVADEGRGIEKRDLARVFEPFHTDKTQGLGIGLFLCERIASQHGGTIRAESEGRGKGARFIVEFPTRTSGNVPSEQVS